jgi:hypothetical protein
MSAAQVVAQLKKWHIRYDEISGWETHNRNFKGPWGPVNGFIWHHTGADVSNAKSYAASTLYDGITNLPGPLCQFSIGVDGTVYLVGWGRANHAGGGDPAVLGHVVDEDYTGQLHPKFGNSNGVDGNAHFYGVEIQYSGDHPMSTAQYTAALLLSAAILDFHGWSEKSVIGHGEWSSDKWDPGYAPDRIMAMPDVRADVKSTLANGPDNQQQEEEDPMATWTRDDVYGAVWSTDKLKAPADAPDVSSNPTWAPGSYLRDTNARVRSLEKNVLAQGATIAELVKTVVSLASNVNSLDPNALVDRIEKAIENVTVHLDVPDA